MAINSINQVQRQEDTLDKVLKGLAIANEVLKVPGAIQDLRVKNAQLAALERKATGNQTPQELAEAGFVQASPSEKSIMERAADVGEGFGRGALTGAVAGIPSVGVKNSREYDEVNLPRFRNVPSIDNKGTPFVKADDRKDALAQEEKYRDKFEANPQVRQLQEVATQYQFMEDAASDPSGPNDAGLITAYAKMLDPTTGVRDPEFQRSQNIGGVIDRLDNLVAQLKEGTLLGPQEKMKLRQEILNSAKIVMQARANVAQPIIENYASLAEQSGFRPSNLVGAVQNIVPESAMERRLKRSAPAQDGGSQAFAGMTADSDKKKPAGKPDFSKMTNKQLQDFLEGN